MKFSAIELALLAILAFGIVDFVLVALWGIAP